MSYLDLNRVLPATRRLNLWYIPKWKKIFHSCLLQLLLTVISITLANDDGRVCASFEIFRLIQMSERTEECIRRLVCITTHMSIGHKQSLNPPNQIYSLSLSLSFTHYVHFLTNDLWFCLANDLWPCIFFSIITPMTVEQMVTWSLSIAILWFTSCLRVTTIIHILQFWKFPLGSFQGKNHCYVSYECYKVATVYTLQTCLLISYYLRVLTAKMNGSNFLHLINNFCTKPCQLSLKS